MAGKEKDKEKGKDKKGEGEGEARGKAKGEAKTNGKAKEKASPKPEAKLESKPETKPETKPEINEGATARPARLSARISARLSAWFSRWFSRWSSTLSAALSSIWSLTSSKLRQLAKALGGKLSLWVAGPLKQLGGVIARKTAQLSPGTHQFFVTLRDVHLKRLLASFSRLSVRLYMGLGGALALTLATSLIAWLSFARVGDEQQRVNEYVPGMVTAFLLAQQANSLAAAAPRLTAAPSREAFDRTRQSIAVERELFEGHLSELLTEQGMAQSSINSVATALIANIQGIEDSVSETFTLNEHSQQLANDLVSLRGELERQMAEAIDDQFFYTITGYRDLDQPQDATSKHFSETEFQRFRNLMELDSASNVGTLVLTDVFSVADRRQLEPLLERFQAAAASVNRSLNRPLTPRNDSGTFARLLSLGTGADGILDLQARMLAEAEHQQELLVANQQLVARLTTSIESHVSGARALSTGATQMATTTIGTATNLLLTINIISVLGALAIGWFYVQPLVERIRWLSGRMRGMAAGDLEEEVKLPGGDEVTEMASALEVFRRSSLEAQRLNLVEKLAEELRGKNDELESVLGELRQAQDQIVMREKLAALGELTAGVAHEIKNPLNFVKNFSEGSIELLSELREVLTEQKAGDVTEEQWQLLTEVSQDLDENLESILRNGERANRIVQDMLSMGRGSGDFQPVDINRLLSEHTNLAFHAARANDPDFQLSIDEDLDPEVGELEVIPHDLGRVFLNMVTNSCHATDQKRRKREEETGQRTAASSEWQPRITISTRRDESSVTIAIRDNGEGIPDELKEKIFNPFFTTKPTDKGTGLGLSLSSDIVRQHGGQIRVESEPGEFTEMQVRLPLNRPKVEKGEEMEGEEMEGEEMEGENGENGEVGA